MRIHVQHETVYRYAEPARYVIQKLRLTPRSHDGQHVRRWRIEVTEDCRLAESTDAFGNLVHTFTLTGAVDELAIRIAGEVETEDTSGVVRGAMDRLPLQLFLRETALTAPDEALRIFAERYAARSENRLSMLHDLLSELHQRIRFDVGRTDAGTTAADAFRLGHGVCQDFAHIFISVARLLGVPARYIGGYLVQMNGKAAQDAGHAWAEAHVDGLGWIGFDPANGVCVSDAYVRVAVGLDYLGAAPVRGAQTGGLNEALNVAVKVQDLAAQQ
jgi:transglutaminase-like putative cysteine protease